MKLLIVAAFAAFALTSCSEEEATHVKSGNEHLKAASADYSAAATGAVDRAYDSVRGETRELKESAADLADKTSHALRK